MKLLWIFIFLLLITGIFIFLRSENYDVVYVKSDIDGQNYLVRDIEDKQHAANLLATIRQNIVTLSNHLYKFKDTKYVQYKTYIVQLNDKIQNMIIMESSKDNIYTSYSVNKGEQIVFCLRSRKIKDSIHKLNLLMYVVLHEISHVACPEYGHTPLFKKIFSFITLVAIEIGLYTRIDFVKHSEEYCGLTITDSII